MSRSLLPSRYHTRRDLPSRPVTRRPPPDSRTRRKQAESHAQPPVEKSERQILSPRLCLESRPCSRLLSTLYCVHFVDSVQDSSKSSRPDSVWKADHPRGFCRPCTASTSWTPCSRGAALVAALTRALASSAAVACGRGATWTSPRRRARRPPLRARQLFGAPAATQLLTSFPKRGELSTPVARRSRAPGGASRGSLLGFRAVLLGGVLCLA